ncbi:fibrillarin-like rRNA/tRNA 2'-O-methyltransferase [Candidatus Micrarchaeota archaeon]|nr:fibrillarin-like rRNA/tRNA 2'-O-methyltransferase [Candidatus Micrarchaeota archaeon]
MKIEKHAVFEGVYWVFAEGKKFLATKSTIKNFKIHGEQLFESKGEQFRAWDPYTSKLAAAIVKGLKTFPFKKGTRVLYLGSASGVTPSFISDVIGTEGLIYCVEFAPRVMREFLMKCERRENMLPIMGDARRPDTYEETIEGKSDVLYEDVAQPDQAEILVKNAEKLLKPGGSAFLAIKSQSIDVTKPPRQVFAQVLAKLEEKFNVLQAIELEPFDKDHLFAALTLKK